MQEVALVEVHESEADPPAVIDAGLAKSVIEGAGTEAVTVMLVFWLVEPPAPVHEMM